MRRTWLIAVVVHATALFALSRVPIRVVVPPPAPPEDAPIEITEAEPERSVAAPEPVSEPMVASPPAADGVGVLQMAKETTTELGLDRVDSQVM